MNAKLQHMLDELADQARLNLEEFGHLVPCAFLIGHGEMKIIACPWKNDEEKEADVIQLRAIARQQNASVFIMLGEAWHATLENGQWDGTPAAEMQNKREVVHMYVESDDDGYFMGMAPIARANGRPTFGKMKFEPLLERQAYERFQKILA